jgi:hypothetical protein
MGVVLALKGSFSLPSSQVVQSLQPFGNYAKHGL